MIASALAIRAWLDEPHDASAWSGAPARIYHATRGLMRISGGTYRGRILTSPKGDRTRPTSDLLRQAMFNVLGDRIRDARVLDLFAGSGALGLEALSRGARSATFVEAERGALRSLRANLVALGLAERGIILARDAFAALEALAAAEGVFEVVFLDPPYGGDPALRSIETLALSPVLGDNALLVVQAFHKTPLPERSGRLVRIWDRRYGESRVALYRKE
jgi:16S rRNA (guanine966-N2)-methyltransferase